MLMILTFLKMGRSQTMPQPDVSNGQREREDGIRQCSGKRFGSSSLKKLLRGNLCTSFLPVVLYLRMESPSLDAIPMITQSPHRTNLRCSFLHTRQTLKKVVECFEIVRKREKKHCHRALAAGHSGCESRRISLRGHSFPISRSERSQGACAGSISNPPHTNASTPKR